MCQLISECVFYVLCPRKPGCRQLFYVNPIITCIYEVIEEKGILILYTLLVQSVQGFYDLPPD